MLLTIEPSLQPQDTKFKELKEFKEDKDQHNEIKEEELEENKHLSDAHKTQT